MNLAPLPIQKFFDNAGKPLDGGQLFTYVAGSNTKIATYKDNSGVSQNTNPISLNFRGECDLWIDPTLSYKFVLSPENDTDPPTNPIWTVDNITAGPAQQDNTSVDTGSVNNISLTIAQISAPIAFTRVVFKAANTNTGATTLQINGGTAKDLTWQNLQALGGGEIQANGIYEAIYDGARWQLQGPTLNPQNLLTAAEQAGASTVTDYGYLPGFEIRYASLTDALAQMGNGGVPVFATGGAIYILGSFGVGANVVRPEAQLITQNTATSGHTITTSLNVVKTEESAWEAVIILSNGQFQQHGAQFWRLLNSDDDPATFESLLAFHLTMHGADNTPFEAWARNSIRVCRGDTSLQSWNSPIPANWFEAYTSGRFGTSAVIGPNHGYATTSTFALEVEGRFQVGDVDGSGVSDHVVQMGYSSGGGVSFIQAFRNSTSAFLPLSISGSSIALGVGNTTPDQDNARNLGTGALRWKEVFAVAGAINTSDATEKTLRGDGTITPNERHWGRSIASLMKCYQWNDALATKGHDARLHWGVLAQEVMQAGFDCGIADPLRYGFLCRDPAERMVKKLVPVERQRQEEYTDDDDRIEVRDGRAILVKSTVKKTRPMFEEIPVFDESGNPVMRMFEARDENGKVIPPKLVGKDSNGRLIFERAPRVEKQITHRVPSMETIDEEVYASEPILEADGSPAWKYGIRYNELLCFVIAAKD
jgi:hypothetical protein